MTEVAVLGAGAWGTALALILTRNGTPTTLCVRRAAHLEAIRNRRENSAYLPGVSLGNDLRLSAAWAEAVADAGVIVMAIPSPYARSLLTPIAAAIAPSAVIISVTKGIEQGSLLTMTQMLAEVAPPAARLAALSGPGFAAEVARGKPAALVAAATRTEVALEVQQLFSTHTLRVYTSNDVIGVELGGAVKNVIAIAAGVSDGLELGSSARAALVTRGLAELTRLAVAAGGNRETMAGLAGLGDLTLTCTGDLSRNRALGLKIAHGFKPAAPSPGEPIAEGAMNAKSVAMLANRLGVDMPIVSAVGRILYEGAPANAMVEELLSRELKPEF